MCGAVRPKKETLLTLHLCHCPEFAKCCDEEVDGGKPTPRDGLDGGWGRHARRARPAHPSAVNVPVPRSHVQQARGHSSRSDRLARPVDPGIGPFSRGMGTRCHPARRRDHPHPAIHCLNRDTTYPRTTPTPGCRLCGSSAKEKNAAHRLQCPHAQPIAGAALQHVCQHSGV
jgi:hypothetical protein